MLLQRVIYQVFEHEEQTAWPSEPSAWHQLDGELILEFADSEPLFISWDNTPTQYCVAQHDNSFFSQGVLRPVFMNEHTYWSSIVGKNVQLVYFDTDHQVLSIGDGENTIFLSSQYDDNTFYGDCVRVSKSNPILSAK